MIVRSPKTRAELNACAVALAQQYQLVKHNNQLFVPVAWDWPAVEDTPPDPLQTVWLPMTPDDVLEFGNLRGGITFQNAGEFSSFTFMLKQESIKSPAKDVDRLFVKTDAGLRVLDPRGELVEPTGEFIPNVLEPKLNEDPKDKADVFDVLVTWLGHEDPVHSLLHHLATALAPGWSAGKLVLLLGKGRNGKSTLLKMLVALLGLANVSSVTRQQMAAREPAVVDLNNKLANVIFDAEATYLKDSSTEKTLIVGESIGVRLLYESTNTRVSTNGLFLEGLNEEPKSRDKSTALQARIVRFSFDKVFALNRGFERRMLSERYLGAFLALLLDHYVTEDEAAVKLAPSQASYDLQVEQLWQNSKAFQYLHELVTKDPKVADKVLGMNAEHLAGQFHAWLLGGKDDYSQVDAYRMLKEFAVLKRKSQRDGTTVRKIWVVEEFTPDAIRMIEKLTEEGDDDDGVLDDAALVDE